MKKLSYMMKSTLMRFGIEGTLTSTIKHYLFSERMVEGIPELKSTHEGICKGCALGKNIKKPFPSSNNRSKEILDLIHSDVCGPMPVKSLGGSSLLRNLHRRLFKKDLAIPTKDKRRSI